MVSSPFSSSERRGIWLRIFDDVVDVLAEKELELTRRLFGVLDMFCVLDMLVIFDIFDVMFVKRTR
jgi:hypothetical protein